MNQFSLIASRYFSINFEKKSFEIPEFLNLQVGNNLLGDRFDSQTLLHLMAESPCNLPDFPGMVISLLSKAVESFFTAIFLFFCH